MTSVKKLENLQVAVETLEIMSSIMRWTGIPNIASTSLISTQKFEGDITRDPFAPKIVDFLPT